MRIHLFLFPLVVALIANPSFAMRNVMPAPVKFDKVGPEMPAADKPYAYTVRPGDKLQITVWKEEQLDREITVLPDGTIDFPLVGSFQGAGKTTTEIQQIVKEKLAKTIPYASVAVTIIEAKGNTVSIIGQVARPGDVVMNQKMTVLQALSQVGGLTTYADDDDIKILRQQEGKQISIPFNYHRVSNGDELETNIELQPGDVIVVPAASLF